MAKAKRSQTTEQGSTNEQQSAKQANRPSGQSQAGAPGNEGTQQRGSQAQSQSGRTQGNGGQSKQTGLSRREQSMPAVLATPFSFLRRFGEEMDRLIEDFGFGTALRQPAFGKLAQWSPQVEMFEREGKLVIRADLPGVSKDNVDVELRDDSVIISGERQEEREEEREGYYTTERVYGSFYRQIPLPEGVNVEQANATFRDGVLEITMPASQAETRGHKLQIQDAQAGEQPQAKARSAGAGR